MCVGALCRKSSLEGDAGGVVQDGGQYSDVGGPCE